MTHAPCTASPQQLLEFWLGELDEARELRLDEHLLACAACSERLRTIVDLGAAVRREFLRGRCGCVLPAPFIRRVKEAGLRVREYSLEPGGSVNCTVTPDDDLVVAHLHAALGDVRRLDVVIHDPTAGTQRAIDVAFDPETDSLTMVPSVSYLRTLGHARQRVQLVTVEGADERVIADYTFNHSPS
jgi:hypothetical protein